MPQAGANTSKLTQATNSCLETVDWIQRVIYDQLRPQLALSQTLELLVDMWAPSLHQPNATNVCSHSRVPHLTYVSVVLTCLVKTEKRSIKLTVLPLPTDNYC